MSGGIERDQRQAPTLCPVEGRHCRAFAAKSRRGGLSRTEESLGPLPAPGSFAGTLVPRNPGTVDRSSQRALLAIRLLLGDFFRCSDRGSGSRGGTLLAEALGYLVLHGAELQEHLLVGHEIPEMPGRIGEHLLLSVEPRAVQP